MPPRRPTQEQLARYSEAFNQSAVRGERISARAQVTRAGETLVFASASIFDAKGQECATATGLSRLSSIPWASGGTPAVN